MNLTRSDRDDQINITSLFVKVFVVGVKKIIGWGQPFRIHICFVFFVITCIACLAAYLWCDCKKRPFKCDCYYDLALCFPTRVLRNPWDQSI